MNWLLNIPAESKGGIRHNYPDKVKLEKKLGNKNDFNKLLNTVKENDLKLFPDLAFLNIYRDKMFDGFIGYRDNARFLPQARPLSMTILILLIISLKKRERISFLPVDWAS